MWFVRSWRMWSMLLGRQYLTFQAIHGWLTLRIFCLIHPLGENDPAKRLLAFMYTCHLYIIYTQTSKTISKWPALPSCRWYATGFIVFAVLHFSGCGSFQAADDDFNLFGFCSRAAVHHGISTSERGGVPPVRWELDLPQIWKKTDGFCFHNLKNSWTNSELKTSSKMVFQLQGPRILQRTLGVFWVDTTQKYGSLWSNVLCHLVKMAVRWTTDPFSRNDALNFKESKGLPVSLVQFHEDIIDLRTSKSFDWRRSLEDKDFFQLKLQVKQVRKIRKAMESCCWKIGTSSFFKTPIFSFEVTSCPGRWCTSELSIVFDIKPMVQMEGSRDGQVQWCVIQIPILRPGPMVACPFVPWIKLVELVVFDPKVWNLSSWISKLRVFVTRDVAFQWNMSALLPLFSWTIWPGCYGMAGGPVELSASVWRLQVFGWNHFNGNSIIWCTTIHRYTISSEEFHESLESFESLTCNMILTYFISTDLSFEHKFSPSPLSISIQGDAARLCRSRSRRTTREGVDEIQFFLAEKNDMYRIV